MDEPLEPGHVYQGGDWHFEAAFCRILRRVRASPGQGPAARTYLDQLYPVFQYSDSHEGCGLFLGISKVSFCFLCGSHREM